MMERLNDAWTKEREAGSRGNLMTENETQIEKKYEKRKNERRELRKKNEKSD